MDCRYDCGYDENKFFEIKNNEMTALITSLVNPKGGSGKTVAAVNLAAGIADLSYKVLLIDLDAHASASLALGLKKDSLPGLAGALIADDDIYDFIEKSDNANLDVIKASDDLVAVQVALYNQKEGLLTLKRKLDAIKNSYDFVFIDCPAGISDGVMSLARPGVSVLCVATPDRTSVRDAERLSMELRSHGVKDVRLVINRIDPSLVKKGRAPDMDDIVDGTGVRLIGLVPEDSCVSACANRGRLVCDDSRLKIGRAYRNIALRISGAQAPLYKFW